MSRNFVRLDRNERERANGLATPPMPDEVMRWAFLYEVDQGDESDVKRPSPLIGRSVEFALQEMRRRRGQKMVLHAKREPGEAERRVVRRVQLPKRPPS